MIALRLRRPFDPVVALLLAAMVAPLSLFAASAAPASADTVRLDVEYGRAGGERLLLDAWVPPGPGPHPAVILVHGGGWTTGDKSGNGRGAFMVPLHAPLQRAGFAWFSINYRLAPKHRFPACVEDVETAIRWVKAHAAEFRVDPRRVALSGESAGGHLVALAAVRADASTRLAAVIPFYAPLELYNLRTDPAEANNVIKQHAPIARELDVALRKHIQRGGAVPWQAPLAAGR